MASPHLVMRPTCSISPDECARSVRPKPAATSLDLSKRQGTSTPVRKVSDSPPVDGSTGVVHAIKWAVQRARYMTLPSWGRRRQLPMDEGDRPRSLWQLAMRSTWALRDLEHRSSAPSSPSKCSFRATWVRSGRCARAVRSPHRRHASVRGRRAAAIMMSVRSVPGRPSGKRARTRISGDWVISGVVGIRVPVGLRHGAFTAPKTGASLGLVQCLPAQAATVLPSRAIRKQAPSTHMRCRITPIRRATATVARFCPRRFATCIPQAFSQQDLARCISTVAALNNAVRSVASPAFVI